MTASELLQNNLALLVDRDPEFISTFYDKLFSRYPEAKPLFRRNAPAQQQKMLSEALAALVEHLDDASFVTKTMLAVGRKHVEYGVQDHMYPWVAECLLDTFREASGADWSDALEAGWTSAVGAIVELALRGAAEARADDAASQ